MFLIKDKYLETKNKMNEAIYRRLVNSQIPLNHIINVIDDVKIKLPEVKVTSVQSIDTCPCGSGKPFAKCHGQRINKKIQKRR